MAFKITGVKVRYFEFETPDTGEILHLEPPTLGTVNKYESLNSNSSPEELAQVIADMISKNKENRQITAQMVMDWMTSDQAAAFLLAFLGWMNNVRASDPN